MIASASHVTCHVMSKVTNFLKQYERSLLGYGRAKNQYLSQMSPQQYATLIEGRPCVHITFLFLIQTQTNICNDYTTSYVFITQAAKRNSRMHAFDLIYEQLI